MNSTQTNENLKSIILETGSQIPCLSVKQPFADLIVDGLKTVELRNWRTKHRGWVLIHASKTIDFGYHEKWNDLITSSNSQQYGKIIGAAVLISCQKSNDSLQKLALYDGSEYRYAWLLEDAQRLPKPVDYRGRPGLFYLTGDLVK